MSKSVIDRIDPVFKNELIEVTLERQKRYGKHVSLRRLTKAIRNLSYFNKIKLDLITAEIRDDRLQ